MSTEISRPVSCPRCGEAVETRMWPGINAEVNPNLREQVLQETLFNWTCPACGYVAQMAYPCLYPTALQSCSACASSGLRRCSI